MLGSSLSPIDFVRTIPMLLFSSEIAIYSSLGAQSKLRILIFFVASFYHFLMKSKVCFPEVELFSSDRTQSAIYPLSEATKKPIEYGLIRATFIGGKTFPSSPIGPCPRPPVI